MSPRRSRRTWIGASLVVVLAAAAVLLWWGLRPDGNGPEEAQATGPAEEVAAMLADLPQDPAAAFAPEAAEEVAADPTAYVPEGATIEAAAQTWHEFDDAHASMDATMTEEDGTETTFRVLLVNDGGDWLVEATIEIDEVA